VPPLRYDVVRRLRTEVADTPVILNGGMREVPPMVEALLWCDGVMIGREAYHRPWLLADLHQALFPEDRFTRPGAGEILDSMRDYARAEVAGGTRLSAITRHMLGLLTGRPGAKAFRQLFSLEAQRGMPVDELFNRARELVPQSFNGH
jgi:tRNA-dihydrouridine synthase A